MARGLTHADLVSMLETLAQYGIPSPRSARLIDVGTSPFVDFVVDELIDGLIAGGCSTFRVFEGSYGAGKTHLLRLIEEAALRRRMVVAKTDLSSALGFHERRFMTKYILENMEARIEGETVRSLPRILDGLGRLDRADLDGIRAGRWPHSGFAFAMAHAAEGILDSYGKSVNDRFLTGERVTAALLRDAGVTGVKAPLTERNAEVVLRTVLSVLRKAGVRGTLLIFDETESVFDGRRPTQRVIRAANLMRRMIDGSASGSFDATLSVFAVLPSFLMSAALAYPALGQRLQVSSDPGGAGWRTPVLDLASVSSVVDREDFVVGLAGRFALIGEKLGAPRDDLHSRLLEVGGRVLDENAGSGYRRELTKQFATHVLVATEGGTT